MDDHVFIEQWRGITTAVAQGPCRSPFTCMDEVLASTPCLRLLVHLRRVVHHVGDRLLGHTGGRDDVGDRRGTGSRYGRPVRRFCHCATRGTTGAPTSACRAQLIDET